MSAVYDENDFEALQAEAEFADEVCPGCGDPIALDGVCENEDCEDSPEFNAEYDEDDDEYIDPDDIAADEEEDESDEGGEA